jgi:hypothetical protein
MRVARGGPIWSTPQVGDWKLLSVTSERMVRLERNKVGCFEGFYSKEVWQ